YDSIALAAKRHTWQLVLVSRFELPENMLGLENVKLIQDWGQVSRCVQRGALEVDSDLIYMCVDDGVLFEDSLDTSVEDYKKLCTHKDILNVRYCEDGNYMAEPYF